MSKINFGTYGDVVLREHCPFCRLVVKAIHSDPTPWNAEVHDEITINNALSWELGVEGSMHTHLKSDGYSNLHDLKSTSKNCRHPLYRFMVATRQQPHRKRFIQYVADPGRENGQTTFFGRLVDPDLFPVALVRNWLERCHDYHGEICEEDGIAGRRLPNDLRLIDVHRRALVRAPTQTTLKYITLSYVWGSELMRTEDGIKPAVTNRADISFDDQGQECTKLPEVIPRTIENAIQLTAMLGHQYLWVDALCIIQDDPNKSVHLSKMDAIYNCSNLTIVAASAKHANVGLAGISVSRTKAPVPEMLGSYELVAMAPSFSELENSKSLLWNTRGWTFQEKILAKRILFVTDYQVYFRCSESIWPEEAFMETGYPSKSVEARTAKFRWAADRELHITSPGLIALKAFIPQLGVADDWSYLGKFTDYAAAIHEYSQRELLNPDDMLLAVTGILRTLQMDAGHFICGLPETHLLQSLLWHSPAGSLETIRHNGLPTWTWAGWNSEKGVLFDVPDTRSLRVIILLLQYVLKAGKSVMKAVVKGFTETVSETMTKPSGSSEYICPDVPSTNDPPSASPTQTSQAIQNLGQQNWTTLSAMSKASSNVALCFGLPLLFQHHTLKHVFQYRKSKVRELRIENPLSYTSLFDSGSSSTATNHRKRPASAKTLKLHREQAVGMDGQFLAFETSIVFFWVGNCLSSPVSLQLEQVGLFELLNSDGQCVGELWTTASQAEKGSHKPLEFLTISWGLTMQHAKISKQWRPRWARNAQILPKSRVKMLFEACQVIEGIMSWNTSKHLAGTYGVQKSQSAGQDQMSARSILDSLLTAKKGDQLPPFLWSTVNLLLVEKDGKPGPKSYRRLGSGKVIFEAWLVNSSLSKESVILS